LHGRSVLLSRGHTQSQLAIDYLKAGESIDDFLEGFPTVTKEQVIAFLEEAEEQIVKMVA
jgi:uncharacterized protein (DUF433 family)